MSRKNFFLWAPLIAAGLGIAGCGTSYEPPARVLNFGMHADFATGAMMVGEGDNLWEIAKRYRLPVREIIELNRLEPPYAIAEGQRLKLPAPMEYRTRNGDTLYSIANMFGVEVYQLAQVNFVQAPYKISSGQMLRIPSSLRRQQELQSRPPQVVLLKPPRPLRDGGRIRPLVPPAQSRKHLPVPTTLTESQRADFLWPVRGRILSGYGPTGDGLYNDGINIAAPRGASVAAAADGVVAYVGNDLKSYGNLVLIRHGGGTMTAYAHLDSTRVRKGAVVRKGQSIGAVGSTGAVTSSQLHFEIRQGSKTYNPRQYLG
jgi:murein DD-endopeptidase MepM/ murein hydrolase activator NlpD